MFFSKGDHAFSNLMHLLSTIVFMHARCACVAFSFIMRFSKVYPSVNLAFYVGHLFFNTNDMLV